MPTDKIVDPAPTDQGEGLPSDSGEEDGDATPGGYDGSGIAGGLDLDQDGMPENTGINPQVQPDFPGNDPAGQAEPPDSEASAPLSSEAVSMPHDKIVDPVPSDQAGEWISGFNGTFWLDASGRMWDSPEQAASATPEEVEARPPTASATPDETYTYDEGAYEDAEGAFKDLRHALKHGDEEERAEALEKLQGYLGGFDKGAEEKTQDGTETQDDQIPSDSANDSDGDPEEVPNTVDKEAVDAPDASGAAVSGPAVGAAGAAVGEAKGLDQDGTETQDNQILSGSDYYDGAFGTMGDTDGDGVLNWEDSDWDTFDRDGDGKEDYLVLDADDDGIVDVKEDADGDGIVDVQDVDADNDGTDDWLVSDFDGDGIEYGKEDDDSDGIENAKDDSDGDGMLDWKDSDSDGNGIDDWVEIFSDPYEFDCFPGEDSYDYNAW
jgi:hypothetical protein